MLIVLRELLIQNRFRHISHPRFTKGCLANAINLVDNMAHIAAHGIAEVFASQSIYSTIRSYSSSDFFPYCVSG